MRYRTKIISIYESSRPTRIRIDFEFSRLLCSEDCDSAGSYHRDDAYDQVSH